MPCCSQPAYPSLATRAAHFGQALASEAAAIIQGEDPPSPETLAHRRAICAECPFNDGGWCPWCGCFIALKTAFRSQQCPKGYW